MSASNASIAVVARDATSVERTSARLGDEFNVTVAILGVNELDVLSQSGFDAIVLEIGDAPAAFVGLTRTLASDERTRHAPILALVSLSLTVASLAPLGPVTLLDTAASRSDFGAALTKLVRPTLEARAASRTSYAALTSARSKTRLLEGMRDKMGKLAHDVRALSGVIVGYGGNLRDEIVGPLDEAQRTHVHRILEAAEDVATLVEGFDRASGHMTIHDANDDLAALERRTAPRRNLNDLAEIVRSTTALFDDVASKKRLQLRFDFEGALKVWCDAMQMKQVVSNLVTNALKFTPEGGRVTVALQMGDGDGDSGTGLEARRPVALVVEDSGPGIPRADRERVFERGTRLDRDRAMPGTGLGLSVVREIVRAHGGKISIEDAAGGGTRFVIALPIDRRARRDGAIVLVDDATAARKLVESLAEGALREVEKVDGREIDPLLAGCRAVVAIPRENIESVEALLRAQVQGPPSSRRSPRRSERP